MFSINKIKLYSWFKKLNKFSSKYCLCTKFRKILKIYKEIKKTLQKTRNTQKGNS